MVSEVSVFDFMSVPQIENVSNNIGGINLTGPCQQAIDSGATTVIFPQGTYTVDGLVVNRSRVKLLGKGYVKILLTAGSRAVFSIQPETHFIDIDNFELESPSGAGSYGIIFEGSNAHTSIKNVICRRFRSGCGIEYRQTVNSYLENIQVSDCLFGILFQLYKGVPCTTVTVNRAYVVVCRRAISHINAVAMNYQNCIAEYCGSKTSNDGAYHFEGGHCQLFNLYGEANYRNFVLVNVNASRIGNHYIVDDPANPPAPNIIIDATL